MRTFERLLPLLLPLCLAACDKPAQPGPPLVEAAATASRTSTPATATDTAPAAATVATPTDTATATADDMLATAVASDAAARAAREQTLRVQQGLREQQRAQQHAHDATNQGERCIAGQRMRRVANGWVGAGAC